MSKAIKQVFVVVEVKIVHKPNTSMWCEEGFCTKIYACLEVYIKKNFSDTWKLVSLVENLDSEKIKEKIAKTKLFFEKRCLGKNICEKLEIVSRYDYSTIKGEQS